MTNSHLGYRVWFSPALPAANTAAGFEALTWTEIGIYQGGAKFGYEHAIIDAADMTAGQIDKIKGAGSGQSSTLAFREAAAFSAAQATLKTLCESNNTVGSIRLTRAITAGTPVIYAQGFYHSFLMMEQTMTTHEGFTVVFQQNEPHVVGVMPA